MRVACLFDHVEVLSLLLKVFTFHLLSTDFTLLVKIMERKNCI